jgi:hypothetical protein
VLDFKTGHCINEFNFNERHTTPTSIDLSTTTASLAADQH